ncbi:ubiquitin [Kipferlia bialata]|uniref:Ubiquitin n=1 Tax=Kipferlia bialata TaxID=797122 RepID=A0A9K3D2T1_9EUKA|nr:ubiquitin [Kipferlia bialata]GIQ86813.1 ubiquitin [Kipferlia bialata]|eukprot:g3493.t1
MGSGGSREKFTAQPEPDYYRGGGGNHPYPVPEPAPGGGNARVPLITLFIKTLLGEVSTYHVPRDCTIELVKKEVAAREGPHAAVHRTKFVYAGQTLEDERTLPDYNIKHEDTIFLIILLR